MHRIIIDASISKENESKNNKEVNNSKKSSFFPEEELIKIKKINKCECIYKDKTFSKAEVIYMLFSYPDSDESYCLIIFNLLDEKVEKLNLSENVLKIRKIYN